MGSINLIWLDSAAAWEDSAACVDSWGQQQLLATAMETQLWSRNGDVIFGIATDYLSDLTRVFMMRLLFMLVGL